MKFKEKPITPVLGGFKVYVYEPEGYTVQPKDIPSHLLKGTRVQWIVNFGFVNEDGSEIEENTFPFKYEIRVHHPSKTDYELFFYDGEFTIPLTKEFHDLRKITINNKTYISAKLVHVDPPCGWR